MLILHPLLKRFPLTYKFARSNNYSYDFMSLSQHTTLGMPVESLPNVTLANQTISLYISNGCHRFCQVFPPNLGQPTSWIGVLGDESEKFRLEPIRE
jgi:hypothetical protein